MSVQDDYTNDMPAECKAIFDKSFKGFLKTHKDSDDDAAMSFAKHAIKMAGWVRRNNKWALLKQHELITREVSPVEIFKVGTWNGDPYTTEDLDNMLTAFTELKGYVDPPVQIGHTSDAFNIALAESMGVPKALITGDQGKGAMALGWISKMWREGDVLIATLSDIPSPLGELIEARSYQPVSVTVMWDYEFMGKRYPKVINSVSLLGVERQAVGEIQGLANAGVYVEIDDSREVTFDAENSMPTAGDVHRDSAMGEDDLTEADLESTYNAMSDAAERAIKNKKGAVIFRTLLKEIKGKMRSFLPKKQAATDTEVLRVVEQLVANGWEITAPADPRAIDFTEQTNKEEQAMKEALIKMLGLAEGSSEEQIAEAITAIQAKAESGPAQTSEFTDLQIQVKDYAGKLDVAVIALAGETRARKVSEYSAVCSQFTHISGTPAEMAERLVTLEAWSPEVAYAELVEYDRQNKAQAAVVKHNGTPHEDTQEGEPSEFMVKVTAYQELKEVTYAEAVNHCSKAYRDLYIAHQKAKPE